MRFAILRVGERLGQRTASLRAGRGQQEQGQAGHLAANLALVRPKLIDYTLIELVPFRHAISPYRSGLKFRTSFLHRQDRIKLIQNTNASAAA
jgi:hypothetical protein